MTRADYTRFKLVQHYGDSKLMSQLEVNLKTYYDWAHLAIGAWTDVVMPTSGAYGGDFSDLRLVDDPSYTAGTVWEGVRKDWVWETGVNYLGATGDGPYNPSGVSVQVGGSPVASSEYTVNYGLGRIIFDTAQSTTATVEAQYAYRDVQVYRADDAPWFRELQYNSFRPDDSHFALTSSGDWSQGAQHRVQLPAIVLEAVPRGRSSGYELGNGSLVIEQDVLFHVVAQDRFTRNDIVDTIRAQSDKGIYLFDVNALIASGDYPLDIDGDRVANPKMYPTLVETSAVGGYRWKTCHMKDAIISEVESINPELHQGVVRTTMEVVLGDI